MTAHTSAFRPASGWQQGDVRAPAFGTATPPLLLPCAIAMVASLLVGVQDVASTLAVGDPAPFEVLRTVAVGITSGTLYAVLFATASRTRWLHAVAAAVALLDALVIGLLVAFGSLTAWSAITIPALLIAGGAAIAAIVSAARPGATQGAFVAAASAVVLFNLLTYARPVLVDGAVLTAVDTVVRSLPFWVLAIAAAAVLVRRGPSTLAAALLWGAALALLVSPSLSTVLGAPPNLAVLLLLLVRVALLTLAGIVVLRRAPR